jgi:hypothetical protein
MLLPLAQVAAVSCKTSSHSLSGASAPFLISGSGRTYSFEKGISVCFATTTKDTNWEDVDALNLAFKEAIVKEWGEKAGVKTWGWLPCAEMPDAMVYLRFFDCAADGKECPDNNKSPHVAFIGPPDQGQGPNYVNLRRTYQDHYRYKECNGEPDWIFGRRKDRLESRKLCTRNYGVHEFGHIIGFDHEQYHPNGPANCNDESFHFAATGPGAAKWKCSHDYDDESLMNYCGKKFINWGSGLSEKDVACAREFIDWAKKNEGN